MKPEEFIKKYEIALGKQKWNIVEPLICKEASVTFSDGSVHTGIEKVKAAFERNFSKIKNEKYAMENISWIKRDEKYAVYLFEYYWSGIIDGKLISGNGIGTSIIIKESGTWKLLTEHLGRKPN